MAVIERSALLPYSAERLFDLVNDVASYPEYMEGCTGAEILAVNESGMEARLELQKGGLKQTFSTRNQLDKPQKIVMELLEGPFDDLYGEWQFTSLASNACKVSLNLRFTLNNQTMSKAAEKLFESVAGNQVNAICQRANSLYGN